VLHELTGLASIAPAHTVPCASFLRTQHSGGTMNGVFSGVPSLTVRVHFPVAAARSARRVVYPSNAHGIRIPVASRTAHRRYPGRCGMWCGRYDMLISLVWK